MSSTEQNPGKTSPETAESAQVSKDVDGGWGWVVVFACFMIHMIAGGTLYSSGLFYVEFRDYFKESETATSAVLSVMFGMSYFIGPVASGLTKKIGCRSASVTGSLLAFCGLLMSTFATQLHYLYLTMGILTGAGFGLMYVPSIVSVSFHFEKKRATAMGISSAGSGIGTLVFSPLLHWLINLYFWDGAMLIVSGLVLNCVAFSLLYRPISLDISSVATSPAEENGTSQEHASDRIANSSKTIPKSNSANSKARLSSAPGKVKSTDGANETFTGSISNSTNSKVRSVFRSEIPLAPEEEKETTDATNKPFPGSSSNSANSKATPVIDSETPCVPGKGKGATTEGANETCTGSISNSTNSKVRSGIRSETPFAPGEEKETTTDAKNKPFPGSSSNSANSKATPAIDSETPAVRGKEKGTTTDATSKASPGSSSNPQKLSDHRGNVKCTTVVESKIEQKDGNVHEHYCPVEAVVEINRKKKTASADMVDFTLLCNPVFMTFVFGNFLMFIGIHVPFVFTAQRALEFHLVPLEQASYLLSVMGISNTVGRILFCFLSDHVPFRKLYVYNVCAAVNGIATILSSSATQYYHVILYCIVFGMMFGSCVSLASIILVELLGMKKMNHAFGLLLLSHGIASTVGSPLAGWLRDRTGSYDPGFYFSGTLVTLGSLICFLIPIVQKFTTK